MRLTLSRKSLLLGSEENVLGKNGDQWNACSVLGRSNEFWTTSSDYCCPKRLRKA